MERLDAKILLNFRVAKLLPSEKDANPYLSRKYHLNISTYAEKFLILSNHS